MKNSTKFWYSVLVILLIILTIGVYQFAIVLLYILLFLYTVISLFILFYCHIDRNYNQKNIVQDKFYIYFIKYNPLYFLFYTCLKDFNNYLNKL